MLLHRRGNIQNGNATYIQERHLQTTYLIKGECPKFITQTKKNTCIIYDRRINILIFNRQRQKWQKAL